MDRFWFLTWTTFGSWLPGDTRGFVSDVPVGEGSWARHNLPGTPFDADLPFLRRYAANQLRCRPIRLTLLQAEVLLNQFCETADYRGWQLLAAGIVANHCHLTVGVEGDPSPSRILGDFKAYGSRALNRRWATPICGTWWTDYGSKRKLPTDESVLGAVRYTLQQQYPLVIWTAAIPELDLPGGRMV